MASVYSNSENTLGFRSDRLRWKRLIELRPDAPIPSWMIFPAVFAALYASHFTLLRLPYYWDEAGYYIPAAWDFFRTGSLIPFSTLTNAHPPLPSVYLALCWRVAGFQPEVTRVAVLLVAAFGLTAVWRLAMRLVNVVSVAFWTVALTALYPVWFAQSTLAHADIFAAACTLWGLVYALPTLNRELPGKPWAAAVWFSLAALSKETAIVIPLTLAAVSLFESRRAPGKARIRLWREAAWLAGCALPLMAWYGFHYCKTGFLFGNPEYLRYNAQANLSPLRILAAFGYRILHLTAHMNLFLPVGMALAALLLDPRPDPAESSRTKSLRLVSSAREESQETQLCPVIAPAALRRIAVLLLANAVFFSVLGGALLTRYLLPMYPLVLLAAVTALYRRVSSWHKLAAVSAVAFIAGLFINPPYRFAPEDNLSYARVIRLHQAGIHQLEKLYPGSTVLSAWPLSDELMRPELGYLRQPFAVDRLEDFTAGQIAHAAQEPEKFSAVLVFSTKYDPPSLPLSLGPKGEAIDERYFGLHHDLSPEAIARELHGDLVWKREDHGQWIALIRFNRQFDARLESAWLAPEFGLHF
jgi:4-amino-4-deoxy-L-arabinose transferase-like glycosyltransferase